MTYRKDIQILRGISVLLVVLYHLGIGGFQSGFLGVDVFFVISGFLMCVMYDKNNKLYFYKRRSLRLLPAYFVTILLTLLVAIVIVTPNEYSQVFKQSLYADTFASNIGFWFQNSYFSKDDFNPMLHLWSLGVEIQFYFLIPFLFFFFGFSRIFFLLLFILSLTLCFLIIEVSSRTSFFMMPLRLWEFLIGYGVAKYLTDNGQKRENAVPYSGIIYLLVILAIPTFNVTETQSFLTGHPGMYALLVTLATGGVLAFGITEQVERSIVGNFLEIFGKYSYSIYLVHFPVIVFFLYRPFSGTILKTDSIYLKLFIIIITVVLSYSMYHLVECKLRQLKHINKFLYLSPLAVLGVAYVGLFAQSKMYSEKEFLIFNALKDRDTYRCGRAFRMFNPTEIFCEVTPHQEGTGNTFLLVGDSHADSIKYSLSNTIQNFDSSLYFLSPNTAIGENSSIDNQRIINEALGKDAISIVLHYSQNGVNAQGIRKLVDLADEHNLFVAFVMPVPTWGTHIPKALWKNSKKRTPLPNLTLHEYNKNSSDMRDSILALSSKNFKVYEVAEFFCDDTCSLTNNAGKPLYFDTSHLTITGSEMLQELFVEIIEDSYAFVNKKI